MKLRRHAAGTLPHADLWSTKAWKLFHAMLAEKVTNIKRRGHPQSLQEINKADPERVILPGIKKFRVGTLAYQLARRLGHHGPLLKHRV